MILFHIFFSIELLIIFKINNFKLMKALYLDNYDILFIHLFSKLNLLFIEQ